MVTVFERDDRIGGLLRYGIPDFKLEKRILDRRLDLMRAEGIQFKPAVHVGVDLQAGGIEAFDAAILCTGSTRPRDLPIDGRHLSGIHFAMDFLAPQNRVLAEGLPTADHLPELNARDKHVVVIGGGDTGSDCLGTCLRQGARSVVNFELLPKPPEERSREYPWPFWPLRLRTSSSHEEGGRRHWRIQTKRFMGQGGRVSALETVDITMVDTGGSRPEVHEIADSKRTWPADLVLLALGFTGPETHTIVDQLGLAVDDTGALQTDENYATNRPGIFAAGDANRGQSLIVWAISEGREAARMVDIFLMGQSALPTKGCCDLPRP
jgi:glutamate synthase (NADPH/NADH) small chain